MENRPRRSRPQWIKHATSFFQKKKETPSQANTWTQVYPPNPREIMSSRHKYEGQVLRHRLQPRDETQLGAIYRIYEHIMLGQNRDVGREFEKFWNRWAWKTCDIPDPMDPDPERYAVVACIPALMCIAFNARIRLGIPRDRPHVWTSEALDNWRRGEREYETEPDWAEMVPQLDEKLSIPHWDCEKREWIMLNSFDSSTASREFERKNVLIGQPHIYFT